MGALQLRELSAETLARPAKALASPTVEQLKCFFESSPNLFCIVTLDGRFLAINAVWERVLGFSKQEILGTPRDKLVHPDDRELALACKRKMTDETYRTFYQCRYLSKNGICRWLSWSEIVLADEGIILASARDITEAHEAEEQLRRVNEKLKIQARDHAEALERTNKMLFAEISYRREIMNRLSESREHYRRLFENALEGMFTSTIEGEYLSANRALSRMLGYESPDDLMAGAVEGGRSFVDPARWEEFKEVMGNNGIVVGFEYEAHRKDGRKIILSIDARPIRDSGGTLHYEAMVEDITEQKRFREQAWAAKKMEAAVQLVTTIARDFQSCGADRNS